MRSSALVSDIIKDLFVAIVESISSFPITSYNSTCHMSVTRWHTCHMSLDCNNATSQL